MVHGQKKNKKKICKTYILNKSFVLRQNQQQNQLHVSVIHTGSVGLNRIQRFEQWCNDQVQIRTMFKNVVEKLLVAVDQNVQE
jgi:hypothetical protein